MFKRFTPSARRTVLIATEEARGLGHGDIGPEHLLLGALRSGGLSESALAQLGLREGAIRARIGTRLPRGNTDGVENSLSADAVWTLAAAVRLADEDEDAQVDSTHILRALAGAEGARQVLDDCEISSQALRTALRREPEEGDDDVAAAVAGLDRSDLAAGARAVLAIVLRRGAVASWLGERGVDEAALRRAFPALALDSGAQPRTQPRRGAVVRG